MENSLEMSPYREMYSQLSYELFSWASHCYKKTTKSGLISLTPEEIGHNPHGVSLKFNQQSASSAAINKVWRFRPRESTWHLELLP